MLELRLKVEAAALVDMLTQVERDLSALVEAVDCPAEIVDSLANLLERPVGIVEAHVDSGPARACDLVVRLQPAKCLAMLATALARDRDHCLVHETRHGSSIVGG